MRNSSLIAFAFLVLVVIPGETSPARAQAQKALYSAMAPLGQYLMPDEKSEIALRAVLLQLPFRTEPK